MQNVYIDNHHNIVTVTRLKRRVFLWSIFYRFLRLSAQILEKVCRSIDISDIEIIVCHNDKSWMGHCAHRG